MIQGLNGKVNGLRKKKEQEEKIRKGRGRNYSIKEEKNNQIQAKNYQEEKKRSCNLTTYHI